MRDLESSKRVRKFKKRDANGQTENKMPLDSPRGTLYLKTHRFFSETTSAIQRPNETSHTC